MTRSLRCLALALSPLLGCAPGRAVIALTIDADGCIPKSTPVQIDLTVAGKPSVPLQFSLDRDLLSGTQPARVALPIDKDHASDFTLTVSICGFVARTVTGRHVDPSTVANVSVTMTGAPAACGAVPHICLFDTDTFDNGCCFFP